MHTIYLDVLAISLPHLQAAWREVSYLNFCRTACKSYGMANNQQKNLSKAADEFLRKAGFDAQARPIGTKSESVKALGTPMGGANTFRRKCNRRS